MLLTALLLPLDPVTALDAAPGPAAYPGPRGGTCTLTTEAPINPRQETRRYDARSRLVERRTTGVVATETRYAWRGDALLAMDYTHTRDGAPYQTYHLAREIDPRGRLLAWTQEIWSQPATTMVNEAVVTRDDTGWRTTVTQTPGRASTTRSAWRDARTLDHALARFGETWTFDTKGRPARRTSAEAGGYDYTYRYDAAGRLAEERNRGALARAWTWSRDGVVGHVFAETNGAAHVPLIVEIAAPDIEGRRMATCAGPTGAAARFTVSAGCAWTYDDWLTLANDCRVNGAGPDLPE